MNSRCAVLRRSNQEYSRQHRLITGQPLGSFVQLSEDRVGSELPGSIAKKKLATRTDTASVKHSIDNLNLALFHFEEDLIALQRETDQFAAGFVHAFTSSYWREPELIRKSFARPARHSLQQTRVAIQNNDIAGANAYLSRTKNRLNLGLTKLVIYRRKLELGAERAILAINIVKNGIKGAITGGASLSPDSKDFWMLSIKRLKEPRY